VAVATKKSSCPVSRAEFAAKAKAVAVEIGGQTILADARQFSSGSLGWYANGKITIKIDGVPVQVQVGLNLIVVGSKELPQ
jgi:hypothetical protein